MIITDLPAANSIDGDKDVFPIVNDALNTTQKINRNVFLGVTGNPVDDSTAQTLINKTLTAPDITDPVINGTVTGTYTLSGTITFPSSVVTITGIQTLTNKTLTSPTINSPTINNATITADAVNGYTSANNGTIYGVSVASAKINGSSLVNLSVGSAQITGGAVTNSKIASGAVTYDKLSNPYAFAAYMGSTQTTIATTFTKLNFNTVIFDPNNNFNTTTRGYTVPVNGYYSFTVMAQLLSQAGVAWIVSFSKDGTTEWVRGQEIPNTTGNITLNATHTFKLAAGEIIYPMYYSVSASKTINNTAQYSRFSGILLYPY
jgi:hypothetical protein